MSTDILPAAETVQWTNCKVHPDSASSIIPVVEVKQQLKGSNDYEARRKVLHEVLSSKIPANLRLDPSLIKNPPKNVTKIPDTCGLLTDMEIKITNDFDATDLVAAIADKKLSSIQVVTAFAKRAAIAHQLTACLTDFFLEEALTRAKELDEYLEKTGKVVGPLHGLPISVKAHMPTAGHYADSGYMSTIEWSTEDSQMIAILRKLGAVFYVKTNQPQGIMHLESEWLSDPLAGNKALTK